MATIKVIDVLDRASILLQDATHTRFPNAELLKFFNDAQREIVLQRPDANMINENQSLATGSKQSLPSNGLRLIDIVRNQNGRSITQVDRKILDESLPNWHESTAGVNKIENYIYDGSDPKNYYVYPKAVSGTHTIEIIYSKSPTDVTISDFTNDTQTITLDDIYANTILDYMMYRAYQKDAEFAGNTQKAMMHYQSFSNSIGVKTQADTVLTPIPSTSMAVR